jgi:hypothetical protein
VVLAGERVVVAWDAPGADAVWLEPGPSGVAPQGWAELALPRGRHRITLHATRGGRTTTAVLHVVVLPADARLHRPRMPAPRRLMEARTLPGPPAPRLVRAVTPRMQVAPPRAPAVALPPLPAGGPRVPPLTLPRLQDG